MLFIYSLTTDNTIDRVWSDWRYSHHKVTQLHRLVRFQIFLAYPIRIQQGARGQIRDTRPTICFLILSHLHVVQSVAWKRLWSQSYSGIVKQSQLHFFNILFSKIFHNQYNLLRHISCFYLGLLQCNSHIIKSFASFAERRHRCRCRRQLAIVVPCPTARASHRRNL
jgi:hypothetical protein